MISSKWFFSVSEEKLDISRHLRQEKCSLFLDFYSSMTIWPFIASTTNLEAPRSHNVKNVQIRSFFWSVFSRISTEYGEILRISPYSVRMPENTNQKKLRIWTLYKEGQPQVCYNLFEGWLVLC